MSRPGAQFPDGTPIGRPLSDGGPNAPAVGVDAPAGVLGKQPASPSLELGIPAGCQRYREGAGKVLVQGVWGRLGFWGLAGDVWDPVGHGSKSGIRQNWRENVTPTLSTIISYTHTTLRAYFFSCLNKGTSASIKAKGKKPRGHDKWAKSSQEMGALILPPSGLPTPYNPSCNPGNIPLGVSATPHPTEQSLSTPYHDSSECPK